MLSINGHFKKQKITGVQRYAYEVIKEFENKNYSFEIIELNSFFAKNKLGHHLWEQFVLPSRKFSLLWSPTNTGPIFVKNQIITIHDAAVYENPNWFSKKYVAWRKFVIPHLVKNCKHVLTVSNFSKSIIQKYLKVPENKITVAYNGVDTKKFNKSSKKQIDFVKRKYGIKGEYIFVLGSMDPRKNISKLLNAWSNIFDGLKVELVIGGGMNSNFNNIIDPKILQKSNAIGYVDEDDLPSLYSGAKLFIFPSVFEGFGLPILEAMACETPVITSNFGAMKEISNDAAYLISTREEIEIQKAILKLLTDTELRNKLIQKGLKNVEKFKWENTASKIISLIEELKK